MSQPRSTKRVYINRMFVETSQFPYNNNTTCNTREIVDWWWTYLMKWTLYWCAHIARRLSKTKTTVNLANIRSAADDADGRRFANSRPNCIPSNDRRQWKYAAGQWNWQFYESHMREPVKRWWCTIHGCNVCQPPEAAWPCVASSAAVHTSTATMHHAHQDQRRKSVNAMFFSHLWMPMLCVCYFRVEHWNFDGLQKPFFDVSLTWKCQLSHW